MRHRYIKMDPGDNVVVLLDAVHPGDEVEVDGVAIPVVDEIPVGHKMAIAGIASGEYVIKYGERIGRMSEAVSAGANVHVHNVLDITEEVYREERARLGL